MKDEMSEFLTGLVSILLGALITTVLLCIMGFEKDSPENPPPIRTQITPKVENKIRMNVSAYCPCSKCCGEYADGMTACGYKISKGDRFVAAPKEYPFGTEMIIPGYNGGKAVKVLDRGGAIKGNKLDLYFDTHQEALQWGRQYLDVIVCDP